MGSTLGVGPRHEGEGGLQDVHWSEEMFGYCPSCVGGHRTGAQLGEAMAAELGPIEEQISAGHEA